MVSIQPGVHHPNKAAQIASLLPSFHGHDDGLHYQCCSLTYTRMLKTQYVNVQQLAYRAIVVGTTTERHGIIQHNTNKTFHSVYLSLKCPKRNIKYRTIFLLCIHCISATGLSSNPRLSRSLGTSVSVHVFECDSSCRVLSVEALEDPVLEQRIHGDRHNGYKRVYGPLLYSSSTALCYFTIVIEAMLMIAAMHQPSHA